jgi:exosortase/archaeosortase family protein
LFDAQHTFAYEVAAACSGIRSLVALLALTTIYGFVNFKTPWKRAVMMLAALPLAVLGNVVRLCFTIGWRKLFGQNAGKAVETDAGFITFAVAVGCAFLLARWLEKIPNRWNQTLGRKSLATAAMNRQKIILAAVVLALIGATAGVLAHAKSNQKLGAPGVKTAPLAGSQIWKCCCRNLPGYKSERPAGRRRDQHAAAGHQLRPAALHGGRRFSNAGERGADGQPTAPAFTNRRFA